MQLLVIFYVVGGFISGGAGWGIARFARGARSRGLRRVLVGIASMLPMLAFMAWGGMRLWQDPKAPSLLLIVAPLLVPSGLGAYFGARAKPPT